MSLAGIVRSNRPAVPRKPDGTPDPVLYRKRVFLRALRATGTFAAACKRVGINYQTQLDWRNEDREFNDLCLQAKTESMEMLETSMYERAFRKKEGGEGDTIAGIFMLKGHNPNKYRDNAKIEVSGAVLNANLDLNALDQADRLAIIDLVRQKQIGGPEPGV